MVLAGELAVTNYRHWQAVLDESDRKPQASTLVRSGELKLWQMTWMDRQNFSIHKVECKKDQAELGFAMSLHTYKSCQKEFEFFNGEVFVESAPISDFIWFVRSRDRQAYLDHLTARGKTVERAKTEEIPDFWDQVLAPNVLTGLVGKYKP